jgi:hypothetical protein
MAHAQKTRFRLSEKRTSPFKPAGASFQSTTGSRGVRISGSVAGYTMFRGSVKGTVYPLHSPVSPPLPLPCVTVCHHISTGLYCKSSTQLIHTLSMNREPLVHLTAIIHSHSLMLPEHGYKQPKHVGVVLYSWARLICYGNLFIPAYVCYRKHEQQAPGTRAITVVVTPAIESDTLRASLNIAERQSTIEAKLLTRTVCLLYPVPEHGRYFGRCRFLIRQICPAQGHDKRDNVYEVSKV